MTRIAAVLVTHDSQQWIAETVVSVLGQSRSADVIVIVDDASTDDTVQIAGDLLGDRGRIVASTATSPDRVTRIAHNFRQGLQVVRDYDVAVLGDHDDIWHPNRIGHQVGVLEVWQQDVMLASDGRLVDEEGHPIGGTLRTAFPVPIDWAGAAPQELMRAVIRHSVATGGASAVRPAAFADLSIPKGWLHDRWWSLVATAREGLRLDSEQVIDYRVSAGQEVGLHRGAQDRASTGRLAAAMGSVPRTIARLGDLRSLTAQATDRTRPELAYPRLLRTLL
jgi:glycosyltransferase involved in cell wall biosynthesis